jgi:hypothetical protein
MDAMQSGSFHPGHSVSLDRARSGCTEAGARICKWVVSMALSRQQIAGILRRAGLEDAAADELSTLPDQVHAKDVEQFCAAHGLSVESLVDRMGGSL